MQNDTFVYDITLFTDDHRIGLELNRLAPLSAVEQRCGYRRKPKPKRELTDIPMKEVIRIHTQVVQGGFVLVGR